MCARVCSVYRFPPFLIWLKNLPNWFSVVRRFHCFVWLEAIFAWLMLSMHLQLYVHAEYNTIALMHCACMTFLRYRISILVSYCRQGCESNLMRIRIRIQIPLFIVMADPNQIFHFNANPDLDPTPHQSEANQRLLVFRPSKANY